MYDRRKKKTPAFNQNAVAGKKMINNSETITGKKKKQYEETMDFP